MKKNTKPRCIWCGKYISYRDFDVGIATHKMVTPDSDISNEKWETVCKRCNNIKEPKNEN